jgi:NAD(P)-dependent dehydrogenase (short-subunit alcohol dehydrogenase family)
MKSKLAVRGNHEGNRCPEGQVTISRTNLFDLTDTNVLLTGGGQGLGKTIALALAGQGANVAILEINPKAGEEAAHDIEALGVRSLAITGDVTDEASAASAVSQVVDAWGRLDVLVNNAGMAIICPAEIMSLTDFKRVFDLDVFGVFICSKAAFAPMSKQKHGVIINMASMCGLTVLLCNKHAAYNAAKAAVIMLTKSLAVEWVGHGIRVNAIAPGYIVTPPVVKLREYEPDRWSAMMSRVPMGRAGEPDELQGAAIFLASRASSYMTGDVLVLDGGHSCM